MADDRRSRGGRGGPRGAGRPGGRPNGRGGRGRRRKVCIFCADPERNVIDYKNVGLLKAFIDDRGRIKQARQTGTCRRHQSRVATAVKRSREMALIPYSLD